MRQPTTTAQHNSKRHKNALMVSNYPSDTAYAWWLMEQFWAILAQELAHSSGGVAYLAYPAISTLSDRVQAAPLRPVALPVIWQTPAEKQAVEDFIRANGITLLYLTDQPYFSPRYAAFRRWGVRTIIIHDHTPGDKPPVTGWKGYVKALRNRQPLLTADAVFCVSDWMRTRSLTNARVPAAKCHVIQNGIPPVQLDRRIRQEVRRSLGIGEDSVVVVTTGRVHPYKRFDLVVEAAGRLLARQPDRDIVFLLIGDGPASDALEAQIKALDRGDKVRMLGFREDVKDLLQAADIAVHAALGEGFSLSILEYMSSGLPVLVPDIPSVRQAIEHEQTGFVYASDSADAIADYIERLAADADLRRAMGARAKRAADDQYSLERCHQAFRDAVRASLVE